MVRYAGLTTVLLLGLLLGATTPVAAGPIEELEQLWRQGITIKTLTMRLGGLERELLAKAEPDECYQGIGRENTYPCPPQVANKVNQAYVWGLTKVGHKLWLGTLANTHCLVISGFLGVEFAHENASWVCEFGANTPFASDWRPPQVFVYDTTTRTLTDKTPASGLPGALLRAPIGLRSAGSSGNVVFLSGPGLSGGVNFFAFAADTGALLGAANLPEYNNIRHWLEVDGVLYAAVGNTAGGGSVLRWTGSEVAPFQFEVVGRFDSDGADLACHEGRLFVTTWPNPFGTSLAGLYMSPPLPAGGLTPAHANGWTKVWRANDYEPDPLTALTYGGGGLHSHRGWLYWGTMHVPFLATSVAVEALDLDANGNGELDAEELLGAALGTHRAIAVFRGKGFGASPRLEVLYGDRYLPVYDPLAKRYRRTADAAHQNRMPEPRPKWGPSGLGNFFNAYTWTMALYDGRLYIGTFDWSYLLAQGLAGIFAEGLASEGRLRPGCAQEFQRRFMSLPLQAYGADLFAVASPYLPAAPVSLRGVGNFTNYGIRTMVADESGLYLGMANPMNLLTDPRDNLPEGGWELIRLSR